MESTGKILENALMISEEMALGLAELEEYQPLPEPGLATIVDNAIRLNNTLREIAENYHQAFNSDQLEEMEKTIEQLWISMENIWPTITCLQNQEIDIWKKHISELEEITALQMILDRQARELEE